MAHELPMDLIERVQITLRANAGLSSYDPHDPTLPPIPSSDATVAGLDPSPPYLRCKHCKGKLLRGLQSIICIHCGKPHRKDVPPDPISFNSTLGYQWLLESLHFDGSEAVGASAEKSKSNRVQNSPKEKISLSELLDLQITWSDEPEDPDIVITDNFFPRSSSTLNLSSVELNNFFSGSERDSAVNASEEPPAISNQIETTGSKAVADPKNLSLSQDPSQTSVKSSINASSDSFTGWEADFQSADSGNQHNDFKSVVPFAVSKVELSAHLDSFFGKAEGSNNEKIYPDSASHPSMVSDLIQDVQMNNVNSSVSQQAELFDAVVEAKDRIPSDSSQISQIADSDWFQDTEWQNSSATSMATNKDDDLVGVSTMSNAASPHPLGNDWIQDDLLNNINSADSLEEKQFNSDVKANDVVSPDNLNNPSAESTDADWFQDTKWQESNAENMTIFGDDDIFGGRPKNEAVSSAMENDWIQHDLLNNISSSESWQAGQLDLSTDAKDGMLADNMNKPSSGSADWFEDSLWQVNTTSAKDETVNKDQDSFDEWNDFASSTGNQDSFKSRAKDEPVSKDHGSFDEWNAFASSTGNQDSFKGHAKDEPVNKDHDSFDEWNVNDFAGLTGNQDSLKRASNQIGYENAASSKPMADMNLLMSTDIFQQVDSSSFSQSDLFSGLTRNEVGTGEVNKIQAAVSTTNRTVDVKVGESSEQTEKKADVNIEITHQTDDIEMLMSQMHDLSFMLESNLSVPSKPDGCNSFSHN